MSQVDTVATSESSLRKAARDYRDEIAQLFVRGEIGETTFKRNYYTNLEMESARRFIKGVANCVFEEEYARLTRELHPQCANKSDLPSSAAEVQKRREKRQLVISRLQKTSNSTPSLGSSGDCAFCCTESPRDHIVFVACKHIMCRSCDEILAESMGKRWRWRKDCCPYCEKTSEYEEVFGNFEEKKRIYHEPCARFNVCNCHKSAVDPGKFIQEARQRKDIELIRKRRDEDISSPTQQNYSRACGICLTESPRHRAMFRACGHVICRACGEQLALDAEPDRPTCPFCRNKSAIVTLVEHSNEAKKESSKGTASMNINSFLKKSRVKIIRSFLENEMDQKTYMIRYEANLEVASFHRGNNSIYKEELRWAQLRVSYKAEMKNLALSAVDAMKAEGVQEKLLLIHNMRRDNENDTHSSLRYSRACLKCGCKSPSARSVFVACSHSICRHCAEIGDIQTGTTDLPACQVCGKRSITVKLFENVVEQDETGHN